MYTANMKDYLIEEETEIAKAFKNEYESQEDAILGYLISLKFNDPEIYICRNVVVNILKNAGFEKIDINKIFDGIEEGVLTRRAIEQEM